MILVAGEALVDFFPATCGECTGYIPYPGGSPHNVAIGLGRLGVPVAFLGRLSRDRFGRMLKESFEKSGVDLRYVVEGDEPTPLSFIHLGAEGEPKFSFYGTDTVDCRLTLSMVPRPLPAEITAIHVGSLAILREPIGTTLTAIVQREHGNRLVSFDPNVRPNHVSDRKAYLKKLEQWLHWSDIVKLSSSDLAYLYPNAERGEIAAEWLSQGVLLVVITHGAAGAVGYTHMGSVQVDGRRVEVVDSVGAGDAFTAGLLAWLHEHGRLTVDRLRDLSIDELRSALTWATRIAGITCTRRGANPPYRSEIS